MRHYLYSAGLILIAIMIAIITPILVKATDLIFVTVNIPENNSNVAGIQKYTLPPISKGILPPPATARSVLVLDLATEKSLYEINADTRLPIASTTKIMTALVGSQYFKPNSILTVKDGASVIGSKMGLKAGDSLSFRALLYGLLLNSGNDAAFTIAENYSGGVLGFVSAMNKKALDLGLQNTHFENPAGLDSPNQYSSAKDLSKITKEALKDYQLARIFATKDTEITTLDKKYTFKLHNLNKLLTSVAGVLGVKTGYTESAKENLVTLVDRNGNRVLIVVLGSDDRFGETTKLIDWTYANFAWQ
jgi:serine-type D-Ala-D-Ala carboxypeptidase (penicillin-binding protein 5/6)